MGPPPIAPFPMPGEIHLISRSSGSLTYRKIDELGLGGERARDGSDLPKLARAQRITNLASVFSDS